MPAALHDVSVTVVDSDRAGRVPGACPLCCGAGARPVFAVAGSSWQVVSCPGCGLARLDPLPADEALAPLYPTSYYGDPGRKFAPIVEWLVRLVSERHVRFLARSIAPAGRVLDVGCGRGVLLAALADRGFEVHGVERSATAAQGADPRARIRIVTDLTNAAYPAEHFDAIFVWHVLEHLREPVTAVSEMCRILRPGGALIVAVPNFSSLQARWAGPAWFHLDLPRHVFHFPLATLRRLLDEAGLVRESEHHFSLRQNPFGWIQSSLNRRGDLPRNGLYSLLHQRAQGEPPPFDAATRRRLVLAGLVRAPIALGLTLLEAGLRSGGTVHVVARKPIA
ncbi:MAG: class I SAM-dependent methyltransferase [Deltaproteobacteria bacterium]|nr:class I SAM-dependent methyltransferase [Deltaproteobacteria bacterium]